MSGHIGVRQSSNLSQQLNLAPQLLNWLKILQASSTELSEMVDGALLSNPALEMAPPEPPASSAGDRSAETPAAEMRLEGSEVGERLGVLADLDEEWRSADEPRLSSGEALNEKHDYMIDHIAGERGLRDELEQAIRLSGLEGRRRQAARLLLGSLDSRGYLDVSLEEVALEAGLVRGEMEEVLKAFQRLAPAGIGARDLRECLALQLRAKADDTELAELLVENYLDHVAARRFEALAEHLEVELEDVEQAFDLIRSLDPEPGARFENTQVEYVEADIEIRSVNGELKPELIDERMPKLRLSGYCKKLLEARRMNKTDLEFIRQKIREASFLIDGISQRQDTMLKVTREIIRAQREFLSSPDGALRPLTMNKVAALIGVHETTVSRAIANKYVRTERGLVEMRSFFKVGYRCADGSSVTPERVKKQLATFIAAEDELKPLTDAHLSERFKKQGLKVARRTVAKYREELGLPSSKERLAAAKRAKAERGLAVAV